jgi:hypothetical protein
LDKNKRLLEFSISSSFFGFCFNGKNFYLNKPNRPPNLNHSAACINVLNDAFFLASSPNGHKTTKTATPPPFFEEKFC